MADYQAMGSALYGVLGTIQYTYLTNGTVPTTGTLPTRDTLVKQSTNPPYVIYQHLRHKGGGELRLPGEGSQRQGIPDHAGVSDLRPGA